MSIEDIKQLIDSFGKIADPKADAPTFMEISGYPHYENVASNILAFFLKPDEAHGLGVLFLQALLSVHGDIEEEISNAVVEREVTTTQGNRIDILIENDSHIIAIENKLFGCATNPFSDYAAYIKDTGKEKTPLMYYLSLFPPPPGTQLFGFVPITYQSFLNSVRKHLGQYVLNANARYLTFALEFLKSLKNLEKGTRMSDAVFQLFADKHAEVTSLLKEVNNFKAELRGKVKQLGEMVDFTQSKYPVRQCFIGRW